MKTFLLIFGHYGLDGSNNLNVQDCSIVIFLRGKRPKITYMKNVNAGGMQKHSENAIKKVPPEMQMTHQQVLSIIIDEDLTFAPHIKNITRRCKKV